LISNILCVVEDSPKSGKGHLFRQIALSEEFLTTNFRIHLCTDISVNLNSIVDRYTADVILVDVCETSQSVIDLKTTLFKNVIAFDWVDIQAPNVNIVINEWEGKNYLYKDAKFVGLEYAMIRKDILKSVTREENYFIVSLGGYAEKNLVDYVLLKIRSYYNGEIVLVHPNKNVVDKNHIKVSVECKPSNFAELLSKAEWVVVNGGTTLMEAVILGKNVISVPKTVYEYNFAKKLLKNYNKYEIWQFDTDYPKLNSNHIGSTTLDKFGAKRIRDIILKSIPANE